MIVTPNMGLTKWDQTVDKYDHNQLATNFNLIDLHDHTPGKGVRIPTNGIQDGAITTAKLADGSVTSIKLANGAVGADQLDKAYVHPLGSLLLWWRPNNLTAVPTGWVIAAGQTIAAANHDFAGGGSITLPSMDHAFAMAVVDPTAIGTTGGSATASLAHSHAVNPHSHTVPGHSHNTLGHAHSYAGITDTKADLNTQVDFTNTNNDAYVHSKPHGDPGIPGHSHGFSGVTSSSADSTNSVGLTTATSGGTTDSQLGSTSIVPPWVGFLPLIKVKL
jgi:hypothetical protein